MKERCRKIYEIICGAKKLSIRQISRITNIPKSSTQRHKKRIEKRNIFLESHLWETEEGQKFIHRLVIVTIMIFGVMCGVGAGKIRFFFKLIRIFTHVGISESSIRNMADDIEKLFIEFQKQHEGAINFEKPLEVIVGADETFFDKIILVLMELASGYIFIEDVASDRTYVTWMEKVQGVINKMGLRIKYVVSDRAKALIKLALKGIKCLSVPDLFHASHEIVKLLGLSLNRKLNSIQTEIEKASATLSILITLSKGADEIRIQKLVVEHLICEQEVIERNICAYKELLHQLSISVHAFNIATLEKQTSAQIQILLTEIVRLIEQILRECGIDDKKKRVKKFSKQIEGIAALTDSWWVWVEESLNAFRIDDELKKWLTEVLLPYIYWKAQFTKTKNPKFKQSYQEAYENAKLNMKRHPLTPLSGNHPEWISWAEWMVSNFQRTSSAVEGRNGCLSQLRHNGRGLSGNRLRALTAIHNFGLRRSDGTSAAERLFRRDFPDIFEWVIERMGELPEPRNSANSPLRLTS